MDVAAMLPWLRVLTMVICLSLAAHSDYSFLMVKDRHWLIFSIPVISLLFAELVIMGTNASNYWMVITLLAVSSISIFRLPDFRNAYSWNSQERLLATLFLIGLLGLLFGAYQNIEVDFVSLVLGEENEHRTLWWTLLSAIIIILTLLFSWKVGVIQGGADVKALILLTLLMPSWRFLPEPLFFDSASSSLPPTFVIFLWASAAFILAPPILILQNALSGNIESFSDLKMAWHATKRPLAEIAEKPVWLLTEVSRTAEGEGPVISNRILPARNAPSSEELLAKIASLQEQGLQYAWVASKHPFIAYLFLASFPLILFGDPLPFLLD